MFRVRRWVWMLLAVLAVGATLYYVALQLAAAPPGQLDHTAARLSRWQDLLARYGLWVHLVAHGVTYLFLILQWQSLVRWVDRRRAKGGQLPLSAPERRRMAAAVAAVCVAYESLLLLRHLG